MDKRTQLKFNIRDNEVPYFTEEELDYYLLSNGMDVKKASYECLIIKAQSTGLNVSGLTTQDSSAYFKMLAQKYAPNNSGVLK